MAETGDGLFVFSFIGERQSQVDLGWKVFRIEGDGQAVVDDGVVDLSFGIQHDAHGGMDHGGFRIGGEPLAIAGDGVVVFLLENEDNAQAVVGIDVPGIDGNGLSEAGDRFVGPGVLVEGDADLVKIDATYLYSDNHGYNFMDQDSVETVTLSGETLSDDRFFLVDMTTGAVEKYHTTHGEGSDVDNDGIAESFGNVPNTGKSSLGFVRTAEVYEGTYKRAVRLDGLSETNTKIRDRAIVFHGWEKTVEGNVIQDRSQGCITLDYKVKDSVLDKIKEGSLINVGK